MSEYTKATIPPWIKCREDFAKLYQLNELKKLLEIPKALMNR